MRHLAVLALLAIAVSAAANPAQEAALRDIEAFATLQAKSDPHYRTVENELLGQVDEIIKTLPPGEWAPTIKRRYFALSERAHAEERREVRAAAIAATSRFGDPSTAYATRMNALEAELQEGKIGPRQHALHALEAARATFPNDPQLIALREAKLPLATAYEMGLITRIEYDERWARARAQYEQSAARRNQAMLDQLRAEQDRIARDIVDQYRRPPAVTCTTSRNAVLGTSTTNCR